MKRLLGLFQWIIVLVLVLSMLAPAATTGVAKDSSTGYQTGFKLWNGVDGGFDDWELIGVVLASMSLPTGETLGPVLMLNSTGLMTGTDVPAAYYGGNFYNGGDYLYGEATSPVLSSLFDLKEAIASWDVETMSGTWVETQVRAQIGDRWSKWYNMGVWASQLDTVQRHSVRLQGDTDGYVAVDTLVLSKSKVPANALQVKVRLFRAAGTSDSPIVRSLSLAYSNGEKSKIQTSTGDPSLWGTLVDVPTCSQMVYPDGGNVWCSPTSTSMVVGYWNQYNGPCETIVRAAVEGTYDWIYDGYGNWPFNTAYAASLGLEGYVARYPDIAKLEPWLKAGVPVIMSIAWKKGELTGAPISSSNGHLIVLVGFDSEGNAIVNDPAAASDSEVRRTYLREELEAVWQENSGGTVYLIFPASYPIPGF